MRDARYMRLISWTLRCGSEQIIYNWKPERRQCGSGPGNRKQQEGMNRMTAGKRDLYRGYIYIEKYISRFLRRKEIKSCQGIMQSVGSVPTPEGNKVVSRRHANCRFRSHATEGNKVVSRWHANCRFLSYSGSRV